MSADLIKRLDEAETKADTIIDEAKKYRKALLTKAREAAEEEIKGFAKDQDVQFAVAIGGTDDDENTRMLMEATQKELAAVESDFEKNKDKTVTYVVGKVLEVPLALTSTQKQALIV